MIPNKLAYFSQGSTYRTNREEENISNRTIAFVGDDMSIATQGKIFGVRGVYPGQEEENLTDEGNTSIKVITTNPLFPLDGNGRPLVGTTISVRFKYTNSYKTSGTPMQLNVNGIGPYNICYQGTDYVSTTSANTTFCGYAKREILYTFRVDTNPDTGAEMPHWVFISHGYESGNTNTIGYQLRHNSSTLPASDKFYRYRLLFTSADGSKYVPANTSTSTNATASRTVNQRPIDPFGEILYYSSTSSVAADSNPGATVIWSEYTFNLGYSFNRTGAALTMSYPAPVYIKCTPQSDGSAIIDSSTPYVQSLPSTNDGKIYIFLGIAYSATSIELMPIHPVYYYDGTGIRIWTGTALSSKQDKPIEFTNWFSENFGQISEFPTTEGTARTLTTEELAAIQDIHTNKYNWETYGIPTVGYWESDAIVYRWITPFMLGSERSIYCIELKKTNDNKYWIDGVFNNFVFSEDLATVATSGSYNDLTDTPNIPTILTVTITSTMAGNNIVYALENGTSYTDITAVLDNGGEVVLKYGDKIYCLSKRENNSLTFSSLQGNDNTYSSFIVDSMSRVAYYSGTIITSGTTTGSGNAVTDIAVSGHQITLTKGETFATESYVTNAINALPTPMVFRGTIGTGGTSTTVPSSPRVGDTYKIIPGGQSLTFSGITGTIRDGDTVIYKDSTNGWVLIPSGDEPSGTVTSIGMTVPAELTVTTSPNGNNPITDSGTFNITYTSGYSIPTTEKQGNWDTAYTNTHTHSNKSVLDGISSDKVSHWDTAYTNNHTHSNKTILDSISQEKVNSWDGKLSSVQIYHSSKVGQNGIVAIEDPLFIVTVTKSGSVYSINSTYNAIVNAGLSVGRTPVLSYDSNLFWLSQYVSGSYVSFSNIQDNIQQSFYIFYDDSIEYKITSIDSAPSSGSSNLVTSGGVYTALAGKQDAIEILDLT